MAILYVDHREQGGWWRYLAAAALAFLAPLVKAEGIAVLGGVLAYELIWRRPIRFSWKVGPFVLAPLPFAVWEWTTADQLQTHRGLGANVVISGLSYMKRILLPIDPAHFFAATGGRVHPSLVFVGIVMVGEASALGALLIVALTRRQTYGLLLFALVGTAPALVVTLGTQSRYIYLAGLVMSIVSATAAWRLFEFLRNRPGGGVRIVTLPVGIWLALVAVQTAITIRESSDLRAAHDEAQALVAAVLSDHPSVPAGTRICLLNSPLDSGSAEGVFADPRLGADIGVPTVSQCGSNSAIPEGVWAYQRQSNGEYKQLT